MAEPPKSFYPTWKLLRPEERKMFLSGYLHGWQDARKVTDIVLSHTAENPGTAVSSLEKVREIFGIANEPVETLLDRINSFYEDSENQDAPLSVAVSAAGERLTE